MNNLNEYLLSAWLQLSTSINNTRVVSELTYNESLICNILYNNTKYNSDKKLTATDLCNTTKMLKSQMNRTLNQLEQRNLITKERSSLDKRCIYITMNEAQKSAYETQHKRILQIINSIILNIGETESRKAADLFKTIAKIADSLNLG